MDEMMDGVAIIETKIVNDIWTNGLYQLEVYMDKLPKTVEEVLYENEERKLVYGDNNGFITYGAISKTPNFGHQSGYRWSSRASVFNGMFGKMGVDDVIYIVDGCRYSGCMDAMLVLEFLPDDFYIIEQVETDNDGNNEVKYYISNPKHEKKMRWYFSDVEYSNGSRRYISRRLKEV